jgi:hypothetical protein
LVTEFRREAVGLGLIEEAAEGWQETRIWCQGCGRRRLLGRLSSNRREFWLRCPACGNYNHAWDAPRRGLTWGDLKGFRPMLTRLMSWADPRYRQALSRREFPCLGCGRVLRPRLQRRSPDDPYDVELWARCRACGSSSQTSIAWLALCVPEGLRFFREQQRIRAAGQRAVHVGPAGGPALVTSYETVASRARLDVVSVWDTFEVLGAYASGAPVSRAARAGEVVAPEGADAGDEVGAGSSSGKRAGR